MTGSGLASVRNCQRGSLPARYARRVLEGVGVQPSPSWLQDWLLSVAARRSTTSWDVTNFVMAGN